MRNRWISLWIVVVLSSGVTWAKLTPTNNAIATEYTVQSGDTLYTIAREHHASVAALLRANHLTRSSVIRVGQKLKIPHEIPKATAHKSQAATPRVSSSAHPKTVSYVVQNGDTFFTIARAHHTSIRALIRENNLTRQSTIKVGQRLRVPVNTYLPTDNSTSSKKDAAAAARVVTPQSKSTSPEANSATYTVQEGDTLFSIARKNHIMLSKLLTLNGIGLSDAIRTGQVLRIRAQRAYVAGTTPTASSQNDRSQTRTLPAGAMPSYRVKKGDTLWQIAKDHHLTLSRIRELNKMSKHDTIHVGMLLAVGEPARPKSTTPPKTYTVKKGDTLWLIAKKHHMTADQLRQYNGMKRQAQIRPGMVLSLGPNPQMSQKPWTATRLKKHGVKQEDIAAVLARIHKSKSKNPDIETILAQIRKEKRRSKHVKTPARVAKRSTRKSKKRTRSAAALLRSSNHSANNRVIRTAKRYLGRRYVWGAVGPRAFDCSGFTQYVLRKSKGVRLPRISRRQAYYGKYVSRSHLRPGDLVFFDTSRRRRGYVNHVGIYIGNNKFIHASSARHRVVITSLNRPFYRARFKWGRRVN